MLLTHTLEIQRKRATRSEGASCGRCEFSHCVPLVARPWPQVHPGILRGRARARRPPCDAVMSA